MDDHANRLTVLKFLDACFSGDVDAALACCDDDFDSIVYAPVELFPHLGHKRGKEWIADSINVRVARYVSRKHDVTFIAAEQSRVSTITRVALRKRNDDRMIQFEVAEFFTLRDGRIVEHRSFFNSFDFIEQLLGRDLTDAFAASVRTAIAQ